jgi:hypothetical protein
MPPKTWQEAYTQSQASQVNPLQPSSSQGLAPINVKDYRRGNAFNEGRDAEPRILEERAFKNQDRLATRPGAKSNPRMEDHTGGSSQLNTSRNTTSRVDYNLEQVLHEARILQAPQKPLPRFLQTMPLPMPQHLSRYGTILASHNDSVMTQRQLTINTLSPNEREEQDEWARRQLTISGTCRAGFEWVRKEKGYRCKGGNHCITDALLAEGDAGFYIGDNGGFKVKKGEDEFWKGPWYKAGSGGEVEAYPNYGLLDNGGRIGACPDSRSLNIGRSRGFGSLQGREMRPPRVRGIPAGERIPGPVLGISYLDPREADPVSSSRRRPGRSGGADYPNLVEYNR